MPFVSEKQRRLCYVLQSRASKSGKKSSWNCSKWEKETKKATKGKKLPMYKKGTKKTKRGTKKGTKK